MTKSDGWSRKIAGVKVACLTLCLIGLFVAPALELPGAIRFLLLALSLAGVTYTLVAYRKASDNVGSKRGSLYDENAIVSSVLEKQMPKDCPFSIGDIMQIRKFISDSRPQHFMLDDMQMRFAYGGYLFTSSKTISQGFHDEFEAENETALFRRPNDSWKALGEPLEPHDARTKKLGFITKRAASATVLHEGSSYHVVAKRFMSIPGTTVITYEHTHRDGPFVEDLL